MCQNGIFYKTSAVDAPISISLLNIISLNTKKKKKKKKV